MQQEMNPQDTAVSSNTAERTLTYSGAWVNTDLEYFGAINQVKETLIIHAVSPPSSTIIPDYLQYGAKCYFNNSLTIYADGIGYLHPSNQKFTTNGRIDFNDGANQTIFYLPPPVISDSAPDKIGGNETSGTYGSQPITGS
jgi:hypothetical protein